MKRSPGRPGMGPEWEAYVARTARQLAYPPTPPLVVREALGVRTGRTGRQRLGWRAVAAVLALVLVAAALLAVPDVRAAIRDVLRLGGVTIWLDEPDSATQTPPPLPLLESEGYLTGETTLAEARAAVDFPLQLPGYPPGVGAPDRVFLQDLGGPLVVLVWTEPDDPVRVRLALHILGPGATVNKGAPESFIETTVNGDWALWIQGPYVLQVSPPWNPRAQPGSGYLVTGRVLVWEEDGITYRLEGDLSLDDAVRIAESLQ